MNNYSVRLDDETVGKLEYLERIHGSRSESLRAAVQVAWMDAVEKANPVAATTISVRLDDPDEVDLRFLEQELAERFSNRSEIMRFALHDLAEGMRREGLAPVPTWEYMQGYLAAGRVRRTSLDHGILLSELGADGWDVVSVWFDGNDNETSVLLKRRML